MLELLFESLSCSPLAVGEAHCVVEAPVIHGKFQTPFAVDYEVHLTPGIVLNSYCNLPAVAGDKFCLVLCVYLALSPSAQSFCRLDTVSRTLIDTLRA